MAKRRKTLIVLLVLLLSVFALSEPSQAQLHLSRPRGLYGGEAKKHAREGAGLLALPLRPKQSAGGGLGRGPLLSDAWTPANTVILSNRVDARFCRDFSTLLKHLRLDWVILDGATVPDAVRDANVILVGRPDAVYTGSLIAELLTEQEIETLSAASEPIVLKKQSPWSEGRVVTLAVGADGVTTRDAAESAVRNLIAAGAPATGAPEADAWVRTAYEVPAGALLDETTHETVERLTFGNAGLHQLPQSRMLVYLPINFGFYPDMEFREEKGLAPDLWVPAADAVNYAVAAVRSGTIPTEQRLTPDQLQQPFVPEDTRARARRARIKQLVPIVLLVAAGSVWAYFNRKRPILVAAAGGLWLVVGSVWWFLIKKPIGYGILLLAAICLLWGGIHAWRARKSQHSPGTG